MRTAAAVLVIGIAMAARTAHAQPALTEPWPQGEEVSDMQQIAGTMSAFLFGFGSGQAIEDRWHESGWKFTLIDSAGFVGVFGSVMVGMTCDWDCEVLEGVMLGSMLAIAVSRYWQTYDAAVGPREHNRNLYAKRKRALGTAVLPMLAPSRSGDGFVGGATLRF